MNRNSWWVILLAIILLMGGCASVKALDYERFAVEKNVPDGNVTALDVQVSFAAINIVEGGTGAVKVSYVCEYAGNDKPELIAQLNNGVLTIKSKTPRIEGGTSFLGFNISKYSTRATRNESVTVTLPQKFVGNITVNGEHGDVRLALTGCGALNIVNSFGDVTMSTKTATAIRCRNGHGKIKLDCLNCPAVDCHSGFDDIEVQVEQGGKLSICNEHASVKAGGKFTTAKIISSFGSVKSAIDASGGLEIRNEHGDINIECANGGNISLRNSFGDVSCSFGNWPAMFDVRNEHGCIKITYVTTPKDYTLAVNNEHGGFFATLKATRCGQTML